MWTPVHVIWCKRERIRRCPKLPKDFQRSKESHFQSKFLVIIVPNFEIGPVLTTVFPATWYYVATAKGAENWSRAVHVRPRASTCVHVRPRGLESCKAILGASFAGLFWALQAPCGVASNLEGKTWKYPTNLHNRWWHSSASFGVSLKPQKHAVLQGRSQLCSMLTGLFRDTVDSFAGLFNGFYYIFTGDSTSKAGKFDILGSKKILYTPLTQKRSEIRTVKRH